MKTPYAVKCKPDTADTPDTFISSIFDDTDSPLSSSVSPVSSPDGNDSESEDNKATTDHEPSSDTPPVSTPIDVALYGTSSSQRPSSIRRSAPLLPGIISELPKDLDTIALQSPTSKRKEQAWPSDVTVEPLQKKVKAKSMTKRTATRPSEPRQLRKSKSTSIAPDTTPPPPAKKAKTSSRILKLKMPPGWDGSFQCAQVVAPVPASSQLTSDASDVEQDGVDSQSSLEDTPVSLEVQAKPIEASAAFAAAAEDQTLEQASLSSTQPTQPWSKLLELYAVGSLLTDDRPSWSRFRCRFGGNHRR
jgi:hypothetical protein